MFNLLKFKKKITTAAAIMITAVGMIGCEQNVELITPQPEKSNPLKTQTEDLQFVLNIDRNLVLEIDTAVLPYLLKGISERENGSMIVEKILKTYNSKTGQMTDFAKQSKDFKNWQNAGRKESTISLSYRIHVAFNGWSGNFPIGIPAGKDNQDIEAIEFTTSNTYYGTDLGIIAPSFAHIQGNGDVPTTSLYSLYGTTGQSRRLEGISLYFSPNLATNVMVRFQDTNNTAYWGYNGSFAGTRGQSRAQKFFTLYAFIVA